VVGHLDAVGASPLQEVKIVNFTDRFGLDLPSDLR